MIIVKEKDHQQNEEKQQYIVELKKDNISNMQTKGSYGMKSVIRSIKNEHSNFDEGERLVRELTSNEHTLPSTQMLIKLKIMLEKQYQFPTIVRMLFQRLKDYNNIRHVEKSLICIEYLIKYAYHKFVRYCQMQKKSISKLTRYRYVLGNDNVATDYGDNIRKRAKRIIDLLDNDEKLIAERAKAQGDSIQIKNTHKNKKNGGKQQSQQKQRKPATNEPQQPQYELFFDIPADNNNANGQQQQANTSNNTDDLLSGNWWQREKQPAFDGNDKEFGDENKKQQSAVGDNGGAFGCGNDNDLNPESWMISMGEMTKSNPNNNTDNTNNSNNNNNPFGVLFASNNNKNDNMRFNNNGNNFGYQYINDPFAGLCSGSSGAPQPAKYVARKKQSDPFAQFGSIK